jgi:hypothetical protein
LAAHLGRVRWNASYADGFGAMFDPRPLAVRGLSVRLPARQDRWPPGAAASSAAARIHARAETVPDGAALGLRQRSLMAQRWG